MSEKTAGQVLTSENAAEFYAERLGLAETTTETVAEEPVEESSERVEESEQSEPNQAEAAKPQEERKQNPKIEKRFSEITKQREEARQEAQREREARQNLEARIRELENKSAPTQKVEQEQEPLPHQFADAFEYAKALTDYRVEQRLAEEQRKVEEAKVQAERQKTLTEWAKKVESAKSELPDFEEMVASAGDVVIPDHVRDAIIESDLGPKILYHLAENPELAKDISSWSATKALREIGKLEAKLEAPKAENKPTVVKSKAPEPIQPIRANGKADLPLTANGEFHGTYQAWKAARKAGKIR
jgi:chromosome condensin MukBEF ATPase and DNA-binding subunit MukB